MKRATLLVALALGVLWMHASIAVVVDLRPFVPLVPLPLVLYLGVTPDVTLALGAAVAFVTAWLADVFTGAPVGLGAFVYVAAFLLTRVAGLRLFLRGVLFQVVATGSIAAIAAGAMLALAVIFEPPEVFPLELPPAGVVGEVAEALWGEQVPLVGHVLDVAQSVVATGLATGLLAPLVYAAIRRVEGLSARVGRGAEGVGSGAVP